jgi:hypothetical protein
MTFRQPQNWQRRFKELKNSFDRIASTLSNQTAATSEPLNEINIDLPSLGLESLQSSYQKFIAWFNAIPSSGKLLAIAGGGLLSLTLIKTVFQLITSLITLSTFGIILYLIYRFSILPKGNE